MKIRKLVAATVATTSLAFGVGATALATTAAAEETTPRTLPAQVCQRAHDRYLKLVEANQKAKAEYQKARDLQQQLLANGHEVAAHRLDTRLDRLRRRHTQVVVAVQRHPGQGPGPLWRPRARPRAGRRLKLGPATPGSAGHPRARVPGTSARGGVS